MAEPILGQALALQSEFRPDTSQVLTRAVDKIGNVTLKKQLAEAKAEEAKAKRLQEIMGAVKLDGAKVNRHFLPEASKKYAEGIASLQESALKGDIMGVNAKKGQLEMEFANMAKQSDALDNFLSLKKQGFYIAPEIESAFAMPKAEGQAYLKKVYEQKPELKGIVDVNEYGDYVFNTVKDIDLKSDFRKMLTENKALLAPTGVKTRNEATKDETEVYKIPESNIKEFAMFKAQDPDIRANIILKQKEEYAPFVAAVKAANPTATPEQIENTALVSFISKKLQDENSALVKSNIPQGKSDSGTSFSGGVKTTNGWLISPSTLKTGARTKSVNPELVQRLADANRLTEEYNKTVPYNKRRPLKTYDQAYGSKATSFDEVYFENKDVPENKTFKMPDGQGGLISMIPLSLRRAKGTENWELVGKQIIDDGEEVDMKVPLTSDVIGKLDVLFGESTRGILNKLYGGTKTNNAPTPKTTSTPAPAIGGAPRPKK